MDAAQMFEEFKLLQKNVAALMLAQEDNVKTLQREEDIKTAMLDEMESQEKAQSAQSHATTILMGMPLPAQPWWISGLARRTKIRAPTIGYFS